MPDLITVHRDAGIATVTMNRPEKMNAFTVSMYQDFGEALRELSEADDIRCILIQGAGGKAFCAGSDIGGFDEDRLGSTQAKQYAELTAGTIVHLRSCRHPTVAKIRGVCIGGGLEIAAMCDIRISASDGRFGIPPNRLGLTLDYDELDILIDLVGRRVALEMLLEGRIFGAEEAYHLGLVSRVVAPEALDEEVDRSVARIAQAAPLSNRWHKAFIKRLSDDRPLSSEERDEPYLCYDTEDYREGTTAFNEKRRPVFKGR
ncbi:enoyl-CoA hydratase/carnithine racemase [Rhodoligotrophos appendicifer]|uniref:enoyl-CoA hydratase/isomerase family protein n=1 Tax=Rhodoligotrophos appendicifer TaxID=987056 RepID=UPI0011811116|nr:enoyl-CoA hydratase-related protein [Rhodoligotrophos appendicifer]